MVFINKEIPIWERYGISLEDYAKAFHKVLDEAFEEHLADKVYFVNFIDNKPRVSRITNICVSKDVKTKEDN